MSTVLLSYCDRCSFLQWYGQDLGERNGDYGSIRVDAITSCSSMSSSSSSGSSSSSSSRTCSITDGNRCISNCIHIAHDTTPTSTCVSNTMSPRHRTSGGQTAAVRSQGGGGLPSNLGAPTTTGYQPYSIGGQTAKSAIESHQDGHNPNTPNRLDKHHNKNDFNPNPLTTRPSTATNDDDDSDVRDDCAMGPRLGEEVCNNLCGSYVQHQ